MENSQSLFKPTHPHQGVAILVLLENSQAMSHVWPDLRDKCLYRLVGGIHLANTSVPITFTVLETSPYHGHGQDSSGPRQYRDYQDGLHNINFDNSPENKISRGHIGTAIEFLDATYSRGQPVSSHLIIVAASAPSENNDGIDLPLNGRSPWLGLAQQIGSRNIHCHLVLSSPHGMGSLVLLFEEILRLQGNIEESLLPPVDSAHAVLRLSARPNYDHREGIRASSSSSTIVRGASALPRRNSYPLDNFYTETFDEVTGEPHPSEGDQPPSLVSQLQQVHGLTKKKVYGTKPARQPFFRDERVKFRAPPAPLTMPLSIMESVPSPTHGGRAISQSRMDRMNRVGQAPIPSEGHRRQHSGWTRRGSRRSTPEADHPTWLSSPSIRDDVSVSPTNPTSSNLSSPVSPIAPPLSTHGMSPGQGMPVYNNVGIQESNWPPLQPQRSAVPFNSGMPDYLPYTAPLQHYSEPEYGYETVMPTVPTQHPMISTAYESRQPAQLQTPPLVVPSQMSTQTPTSSHPTAISSAHGPPHPSDRSSASASSKKVPLPDDEERFSFSDDFVAATAALFEAEVLPAYPNYPGMSSGLFTNGTQETAPLPPAQAGELYASRDRRQARPSTSLNLDHAMPSQGNAAVQSYSSGATMEGQTMYSFGVPSHPPSYGSSLTGWAG